MTDLEEIKALTNQKYDLLSMTEPQEIKTLTNQRNMTSYLWLTLKRLKL